MSSGPRGIGVPLHWILLWSVVLIALASGYKYVVTQNYSFLLEAACDPTVSECYVRDCEIDYCPPNELSVYTVYEIAASKFPACVDNECSNLCTKGECVEIACSSQDEVICSERTL